MDITELLARTRDVDAVIKTIDQKLGRAQAPLVVEQAPATDADLGEIARVSSHGYVASCRCLAVARPPNEAGARSVELVDLDGGASTVLMEAPADAAVAACALLGGEVLVVAAWGDACVRWRLARDGTTGWRVVAPRKTCAGLASTGTILVATSGESVTRCAGTVVDVLIAEDLTPVGHFSVGGAGRSLAWNEPSLAVAGAGGLAIWTGGSKAEVVIPTPCRCVAFFMARMNKRSSSGARLARLATTTTRTINMTSVTTEPRMITSA